MGQPSQNGPLTVQPFRSLLLDIMKAPFVVPTSIVTPSWFIAVALRLLDHALSYMSCTRATAALCSRARLQQKSRPPPSSNRSLHKGRAFRVITKRYKEFESHFRRSISILQRIS